MLVRCGAMTYLHFVCLCANRPLLRVNDNSCAGCSDRQILHPPAEDIFLSSGLSGLERYFRAKLSKMSDLEIELTAPNGVKYRQPTGLWINNEWVKAKKGEKITSINPTYVGGPAFIRNCSKQWSIHLASICFPSDSYTRRV